MMGGADVQCPVITFYRLIILFEFYLSKCLVVEKHIVVRIDVNGSVVELYGFFILF